MRFFTTSSTASGPPSPKGKVVETLSQKTIHNDSINITLRSVVPQTFPLGKGGRLNKNIKQLIKKSRTKRLIFRNALDSFLLMITSALDAQIVRFVGDACSYGIVPHIPSVTVQLKAWFPCENHAFCYF